MSQGKFKRRGIGKGGRAELKRKKEESEAPKSQEGGKAN